MPRCSICSMARVASIVANDGDMPVTRFVMSDAVRHIHIYDTDDNEALRDLMKAESRNHSNFRQSFIGGKTGTAERVARTYFETKANGEFILDANGNKRIAVEKYNDGWYVCFIEDAKVGSVVDGEEYERPTKLAVAVRLERVRSITSKQASVFVKDYILPLLESYGYLE